MQCKIAEFIGSIQDGGAETLVKDYALMLDKNKFDIVVIVLRRSLNTANDKILADNGIKIVPICKSNFILFKVIQRLNYWWYVPYRLKKILQEENVNVLHVHLQLLKYVMKISSKIKGIRVFYTAHSEPKRLFLGKNAAEGRAAEKLIKNNNLQMIALHDDMRKEINEMFHIDNTCIIRNGINFNRFHDCIERKEDIRKSLGIPKKAFVIGHVGRFHILKNHSFLIKIFDELCRRRDNSFLLLVGEGKLKSRVENDLLSLGLRDKCLILSHRSDIPQILKAMDVFVFPSLLEGLGIALIEAQVSGLRCVASDAVPQEAFKTELAIPVSLSASPQKWCDIILDKNIKGVSDGHLDDYDMNKEIKRLEELYIS